MPGDMKYFMEDKRFAKSGLGHRFDLDGTKTAELFTIIRKNEFGMSRQKIGEPIKDLADFFVTCGPSEVIRKGYESWDSRMLTAAIRFAREDDALRFKLAFL